MVENVKCGFQWKLVPKERVAGEVQAVYVKIEWGTDRIAIGFYGLMA